MLPIKETVAYQTLFSWISSIICFNVSGVLSFIAMPRIIGWKTPLVYSEFPICLAQTYVSGLKKNMGELNKRLDV